HKSDIGGPVPGSCWSQAREIFQEGLHLPPLKYASGFEPSRDIEAIIGANSRTPELVVGDMRGQVGAARLGEKRFQEMMDRYGKETVLACYSQLFDLTEAKARAEIASWPDGAGAGERFVDSDGIDLDKPVRIHVGIEKTGDRLLFDFTGCAGQTKGPANIRPTVVRAACSYCLTALVDPALAINHGLARIIEIKVREGSVVHPFFPAPVNTYNPTVHALVEALFEALSRLTPHKKVADGCSSRSIIVGGRSNKTGKSYVQYEIFGGGSGGRSGKDGVSGTNVNQSNARIAPVEIIESEFSTRLNRFELMGKTGRCALNPDTEKEKVLPSRYSDLTLHPGEVVRLETPGGGGLGDPLNRDPERVLSDVQNGYVSAERARALYGVVIERRDGNFRVDDSLTRKAREKHAQ
ncbi:MAG: hydantoinase B/oxoprolinase family protein, partial [Deltaproteobacteria bacterium]|nr:hydantoinase B/oxoprolinase family protein [Deltaproteobacteria bacterium]